MAQSKRRWRTSPTATADRHGCKAEAKDRDEALFRTFSPKDLVAVAYSGLYGFTVLYDERFDDDAGRLALSRNAEGEIEAK